MIHYKLQITKAQPPGSKFALNVPYKLHKKLVLIVNKCDNFTTSYDLNAKKIDSNQNNDVYPSCDVQIFNINIQYLNFEHSG